MRRVSTPALNAVVAFANAPEVVLRREELMLRGSGRIGFGHSVELPDTETVAFTLRG